MSFGYLLEIAANSLGSALAAQAAGADRVELCENLGEGGTTPSPGTLTLARERLRIPLQVLIRPRGGDFLYNDIELEVMRRDIEFCARLGCDGIVIGALDAQGEIDARACRSLIAAASGLDTTFHRAFDAARDQSQALEEIIALGCTRVLTSGAAATALEGADAIALLVKQARGRIKIMAGAGVTAQNLPQLAARSHADEFHASAKMLHRSATQYRNPNLRGLDADFEATSEAKVRELVAALGRVTASDKK